MPIVQEKLNVHAGKKMRNRLTLSNTWAWLGSENELIVLLCGS